MSMALKHPKTLWSYNPSPTGCVMYLPLWHPNLGGLKYKSIDPFGHTCTRTPSGVLHFTGSTTSNVNVGTIHDATDKLWISFWFKLDSAFSAASSAREHLFCKYDDATNYLKVSLYDGDGKLYLEHREGNGAQVIFSAETSWLADTWYHIIASCSTVAGQRLRLNGGVAVTGAGNTAISLTANVTLGSLTDGGTAGLIGEMKEVVIGTDDLSAQEEVSLYVGILPGDETEYWPMDEGSGLTVFDQEGTADADGTIDSACTWENVPQHQRSNGHYFDGFDDHTDITPVLTNALAATTTGTIGLWVKVPDATPGGAMAFIAFGDTDGNEYLRLLIRTDGKFQCNAAIAGDACWSLITDNAVFSDNVWAYVELIHDGTSASARINGVAVGQTLTDQGELTAWFGAHTGLDNGFIGKSSFNNDANRNFLIGIIGEVIIHNRALSTVEGLHNYNATRWRYR